MSVNNINPQHYRQRKYECIEFTRKLNFTLGNAFKYVWRCFDKGGEEDLEKAIWYLLDFIENDTCTSFPNEDYFDAVKYELNECFPTEGDLQKHALLTILEAANSFDEHKLTHIEKAKEAIDSIKLLMSVKNDVSQV